MSAARGSGDRPISAGNLRWVLDPPDGLTRSILRRTLERWREIERDPRSVRIKGNPVRTVLRIDPFEEGRAGGPAGRPAGAGGWILKQYRHGRFLDRLRHLFVPSRARQEWLGLNRMRALGFPAPRPLAFGERRSAGIPVEGGLVMEEIPGAVKLISRLRSLIPDAARGPIPPEAAELLQQAGVLIRSLHEKGVDHPDLHAGNLLVGEEGPEGSAIHVIDLHSVRFRRRLSQRRRRIGLAKFVNSLEGTVPPGEMGRLLAAYLGGADPGAADRSELSELEEAIRREAARIEGRHLRSRGRRCFVESSRFTVERTRGSRLFLRREVSRDLLAMLFSEAGPGAVVKRSPEGWVKRAEADGRFYLVKRRRHSLWESIRAPLEGHRLRRAYKAGFALEVCGIPTPRVLALLEERSLGLVRSAWLLTELVPGGEGLDTYLRGEYFGKPPPKGEGARRKFILSRRIGELIRAVHDARIYTQDLSPQNIIVSREALEEEVLRRGPAGAPEKPLVYLGDLDSVFLWRRLTRKRRLRNLVQAGNLSEGHVTWADRLRALRAYSMGENCFLEPRWLVPLREGLLKEADRTLGRMLREMRER